MAAVVTGEAVVLELRPASFGARMLGTAIDIAVQVVVLILLLVLLEPLLSAADPAALRAATLLTILGVFLILPVTVETLSRGRSVGKLAMGLRIVRDDGGAIRFRHAFIRALVGILEIYLTLGSVAFLAAIFNDRSKRVGDMLAGTYSLRDRVVAQPPAPLFMPPELAAWAEQADLGRLPDPLARRMHRFLQQAPRMAPQSRMAMAAALADEASGRVAPLPPPGTHPEAFLQAVLTERRNRDYRRLAARRQRGDQLAGRLHRLPFEETPGTPQGPSPAVRGKGA